MTKNFKREDFNCKCGCGLNNISMLLVELLQEARDELVYPITISSGCRCESHNKHVGGKPESEHLIGLGVDVGCHTSQYRYLILPLLLKRFNRVGIGSNFIHIGIDKFKPQDVVWIY
ncbi:MAG: hypothetical protein A2163_00740 [Actinobacteria bacterium RBG_13_35_12]|nr:MAG: hypothetical protein A2163_00740 [Actinobacteria bacterium RBG_13_35_12]